MTGHVGAQLVSGASAKAAGPGSFRVREQREHFPEQSSCRGQGHGAVLANHASWDTVSVRLPGAAWLPTARQGAPGSGRCLPCPGSGIGAARPVQPRTPITRLHYGSRPVCRGSLCMNPRLWKAM